MIDPARLQRSVEFFAELGHCSSGGTNLAQQAERNRAVGLENQVAIQVLVGKRLHPDLVAHVELVRS